MSDKTTWATASTTVRKQRVGSIYIRRDSIEDIIGKIDMVRERSKFLTEPTCILVTGASGTGKSSMLVEYLSRNPPVRVEGVIRRPVLYVELPVRASMIDAAAAMLRALEDVAPDRGKLDDRSHRVRTQMKAQGVQVVLIDEFQHIVEATASDRTLNKVGDWLKQQAKQTGIPFILAGTPPARAVVDTNEQFGRICPFRYMLGPFSWASPEERRDFQAFLARLDSMLPFDQLAGLGAPDVARRLFLATEGSISRLMNLIRYAAFDAIERGVDRIEMEDLAVAFQDSLGAISNLHTNPFVPDDDQALQGHAAAPATLPTRKRGRPRKEAA